MAKSKAEKSTLLLSVLLDMALSNFL